MFITVFTYPEPDEASLSTVLVLSSHRRLGLTFLEIFSGRPLCAFVFPPVRVHVLPV
jgi:hypothetical protein